MINLKKKTQLLETVLASYCTLIKASILITLQFLNGSITIAQCDNI